MEIKVSILVRYFFICLSAMLVLQSCTSIEKYNYNVSKRKYAPQELRKDLTVMRSALEEAHPGLYWYISKPALEAKFDSVYNSLTDSLSMMQFYLLTAPVVAQIRCGHTRLIMRAPRLSKQQLKEDKAKGKHLLNQVDYRIEKNKLYIIKNHTKDTLLKPGDELVAINNKLIKNVLDTAKLLFASDGYNTTYFNRGLEKNPYGWYRLSNKRTDTLHLQIRDSAKLKDVTYIRKIAKDTTKSNVVKKDSVKKANKKQRYKGFDERGKPILDLRYLEKDSTTAVLKVQSFTFAYNNHNKFYKESFADIKSHGVKNLILDMRYNGGGSLQACRNLYAYLTDSPFVFLGKTYAKKRAYQAPINPVFNLVYFLRSLVLFKKDPLHGYTVNLRGSKPLKPKANHYDGNLQVLINGYTFSAASLVSSNLKENNRATFIGEETGGGFNECSAGQLPLLKLPNTKLILRLPLFRLAPNASTPVKGHGIYPDKTVIPTVAELKQGKDPELEAAIGAIRQ